MRIHHFIPPLLLGAVTAACAQPTPRDYGTEEDLAAAGNNGQNRKDSSTPDDEATARPGETASPTSVVEAPGSGSSPGMGTNVPTASETSSEPTTSGEPNTVPSTEPSAPPMSTQPAEPTAPSASTEPATSTASSSSSGNEPVPSTAPTASAPPTMSVEPTPSTPPPPVRPDGPCDVFAAAGNPCVAAYSTVRALLSSYDGPLYQVRSGSSTMNTGSGGQTHDIGVTAEGFADAAAQNAACAGTTCTISKLYDQSGNGNDMTVAKKGTSSGGANAASDDFESVATDGPVRISGHDVYSLYMAMRQGYRLRVAGNGTARGSEAQGIYMLTDGTHVGTACCWEFGNVSVDPLVYTDVSALFFGKAFWGMGAGQGPWFMADFQTGVWAGGSSVGDPGWGGLVDAHPANPNNPSLAVPFALGFLKTDASNYALSMADIETANTLTVAYEGALPMALDLEGSIVLGVGSDNSNNSFGTFFEGAVVSGYPSNATETAVLKNVQAAGYGQ